MTNYKPGEVVLVPFPFADLSKNKKRPALVLTAVKCKTLPPIVIVTMITSRVDSEMIQGDFLLKKWKEAGLLHPSKVRLAKIVSVESNLIISRLSSLSSMDWDGVQKEFFKLFPFA